MTKSAGVVYACWCIRGTLHMLEIAYVWVWVPWLALTNVEVTLKNFSVVVDFLCFGARNFVKKLPKIYSNSVKNRIAKGMLKKRQAKHGQG